MINLMLITNQTDIATYAIHYGVSRIMIDLETLGKQQRQGHLNTLISDHQLADVKKMREAIGEATLVVRTNPLHESSRDEIDQAISNGADILMLPMFKRVDELQSYCEMVSRRVPVMPLVETPEAMQQMEAITTVPGVSEIYIGLNDLRIALQLDFIFEPLINGMLESAITIIKSAGLPFGFGGIACMGQGDLPAELILAEHVRYGSSCVILSRAFHRCAKNLTKLKQTINLPEEITRLRDCEKQFSQRMPEQVQHDHQQLNNAIAAIISKIELRRATIK